MKPLLKKSIAECLGTFVLVFCACGVAALTGGNIVATALAFGLVIVSMAYSVGQFLQYAHERPDKTFILCDFKGALAIREYEEQRTALQFHEWYEYNIPNVILPFWIFNNLSGLDMIGRD